MKYVGHSVVYYQGAHGYKLCAADDGSFYTVYFDAGFLPIRILLGKQNVISGSMFREQMDVDPQGVTDPYSFNPDKLIDMLVDDLKKEFDVRVRIIV